MVSKTEKLRNVEGEVLFPSSAFSIPLLLNSQFLFLNSSILNSYESQLL